MPPASDPPPSDDPSAASRVPGANPELEKLRAHYDSRRRWQRFALTGGTILLAGAFGVAVWLFIRYPLRAMQQHGRQLEAGKLAGEAAEKFRAGDSAAAADAMRKRLALIDREREPLRWAKGAILAAGEYHNASRYDDARAILDDAIPWAERHPKLGPDALETIQLLDISANLASDQGQDEVAEKLFQRNLATSERVLGPEHECTLMFLNNYGWFLIQRSRLDEAEPLLTRSVAGMEKTGRGESKSMSAVLDSVAHLWDKQGRLGEAIDVQRRAVKLARTDLAEHDLHFQKTADYLAEMEARQSSRSADPPP